jgi:hypothetical protein
MLALGLALLTRRALVLVIAAALAGGLASAAQARSKTWSLTVNPTRVTQGGSVTIRTTAGRKCGLTIRVGGTNFHYRLPRLGERFDFSRSTPVGRGRVTVFCEGLVASVKLTVIRPPAKQLAPTSSAPTTPSSNPTATAPQTPITVANVCGLNPALGPIHYTTTSQGYPTAYWEDGSGKLTLFAFSNDGDAAVDIAGVVGPDGHSLAYFAHCNWDRWLTVAQFEATQVQQGISAAQASSVDYLLLQQYDDAINHEDQTWFQPEAGWQACPDDSSADCLYEPVDP